MFDVVFCQNVLIYFNRQTRLKILDELFARTRQAGLLVLGAGEDIGWNAAGAERVATRGVTAFKKLEV
jgi:chemotaxis methyl-accepting protein methylase